MNRKTLTIGFLSLSALILAIANLLPMQPVLASESIKDRDYQVVTARVQQGGEGLYILDNKTGLVAVFTWDVAARAVRVRAVMPMVDAFAGN